MHSHALLRAAAVLVGFLTCASGDMGPLAPRGNVFEIPLRANRFSTVRLLFASGAAPVQLARK